MMEWVGYHIISFPSLEMRLNFLSAFNNMFQIIIIACLDHFLVMCRMLSLKIRCNHMTVSQFQPVYEELCILLNSHTSSTTQTQTQTHIYIHTQIYTHNIYIHNVDGSTAYSKHLFAHNITGPTMSKHRFIKQRTLL